MGEDEEGEEGSTFRGKKHFFHYLKLSSPSCRTFRVCLIGADLFGELKFSDNSSFSNTSGRKSSIRSSATQKGTLHINFSP